MQYILALDQGTSSSRAIIFNQEGHIVSQSSKETTLLYPHPGYVEQDAEEIWHSQKQVALNALSQANLTAKDISAIGITNQRETVILWDRISGLPIYNAIVWQDIRTASRCEELKIGGHEALITDKTGLIINPYFSATKMQWVLENIPRAKKLANEGNLCIGTVDTWLVFKLTQGKSFVTDSTNASRTMLFNIHSGTWDANLLSLFSIPLSSLPDIQKSTSLFGECEDEFKGVPICGIAGDQHAALFGQSCTKEGMIKNTYGTGCFTLIHSGNKSPKSTHGLLTTLACQTGSDPEFALEGGVFIGGAAVKWLRDGLGIIKSSSEVEALSKQVETSEGVYFVPAFNGLGAPHWDTHAKGLITGITASTNKAHIARATVESMAYQTADVIFSMLKDLETSPLELRVDGGAACNDILLQFQANILDIRVTRPKILETTALGVAYLAGLEIGCWRNISEIESLREIDKIFEPSIRASERDLLLGGWNSAIKKSRCANV